MSNETVAGARDTSYDAEMIACGMGLRFATTQPCETIHVVVDNESVLKTILYPGLHGQQLVSVRACMNVPEWLEKDVRWRVVFHCCPSRADIEWNELMDEDTKQGGEYPVASSDQCLLADAKHLLSSVPTQSGLGGGIQGITMSPRI